MLSGTAAGERQRAEIPRFARGVQGGWVDDYNFNNLNAARRRDAGVCERQGQVLIVRA
jgi:hypothetical protein